MNRGTLQWLLLAPLLLYALGVVLVAAPPLGVASALVALAAALPILDVATQRFGVWTYAPLAAAGVIVVTSTLSWSPPGWTAPTLVGLMVGGPLAFLGAYWRARGSVASAVLAYPLGAELALVEVTIARAVGGGSGARSAGGWLSAAHDVLTQQGESLGAFGHGAAIPPTSLATVPDVGFVSLVLLALVGLLVSWLLPMRGSSDEVGAPPPAPPSGLALRRTLVSIGVAAGAVLAFEGAALATTPQIAIVGLCVAVAEMVVALAVASRWPSPTTRGRPKTPVSVPSVAPVRR